MSNAATISIAMLVAAFAFTCGAISQHFAEGPKHRFAQAEIDRLKQGIENANVALSATCDYPALWSDGRLDWGGYSYQRIEVPKPQPRRAVLPSQMCPEDTIHFNHRCWPISQYTVTRIEPATTIIPPPESHTGSVLLEKPGGSLKFKQIKVPRNIQ